MIVRRVLFNNAGPFLSEWEVELPEGVTAVVAEYEDAADRSNRAGKSFLAVDGLLYALFGKFRGRTDDFVHRVARGREEGFVEYELETSEGARHVIRRGRDRSGGPIRELDGSTIKEGDLETAVVEEILGLSYDELVLTNVFVQEQMHSFMAMTPAEKRRVVSPWFKTDRWVPRFELAKSRLTAARRKLFDLEREKGTLEKSVEDSEETMDDLPDAKAELEAARELVDEVMEKRATIVTEIESDAARRKKRSDAESALSDAVRTVELEKKRSTDVAESADRRLSRARKVFDDARGRDKLIGDLELRVAVRGELIGSIDELRVEMSKFRTTREADERKKSDLLESYRTLTDDRTGVCPVLREKCDRVVRDEKVVSAVRREGLMLRRAIDRTTKRIEGIEWKLSMTRSELGGVEDDEKTLAGLRAGVSPKQCEHEIELAKRAKDEAVVQISRVKQGKTAAAKVCRSLRKALEALPEESDDGTTRRLAFVAAEREVAENARDAAENRIAELRALEASGLVAKERIEAIEAELVLVRTDVEMLAWSTYAFGATGIPSRELENAFGVAEGSMNSVLTDLGAPTRLRFSPSRELKDWEPACLACATTFSKGERKHVCIECGIPRRRRRRDELRLEVLDGINESSFELDSGGGKVLLSLGVRLGLAQLPGNSRRVRCETAIVDEPDGSLDGPNRTALHRVLRDRFPALGIRQTLLITHADVRDEFDSVVVVRRWPDEDRSGFWRG